MKLIFDFNFIHKNLMFIADVSKFIFLRRYFILISMMLVIYKTNKLIGEQPTPI